MLLIDPHDGVIRDVNDAACAFYGYSRAQFRGMLIHDINTMTRAEIQQEMARVARDRRHYFEFVHRLADSSVRLVDVYSSTVNVSGESLLLSVIHDAAKLESARGRSAELHAMYQATLESLDSIVVVIDRDFNVVFTNWDDESAADLPAEVRRELVPSSRPKACHALLHDRLRPCPWCRLHHVFQSKEPLTYVIENDETGVVHQISAVPLISDGVVTRVVENIRDVTQFVRQARDLERTVASLEALSGEMHHRVKNNLQIVASLVSVALSEIDDATSAAILSDTRNRIQAMALVHEALYQREGAGAVEITAYLRSLLTDVVTSLGITRLEAEVIGERVEIPLSIAVSLGQIANELITNAVKYGAGASDAATAAHSAPPSVRVSVAHEPAAIVLTVEDSGPGWPAEAATPSASRSTPELGTTLISLFVGQLHGTIHRDRSPAFGGARATVRIPLP